MKRADNARYVLTETAVSLAVSATMTLVPTALSLGVRETAHALDAYAVMLGATPQLLVSAFMSALVPSLLTWRRQIKGKLLLPSAFEGVTVGRIAVVSLLVAASSVPLGLLWIGLINPWVEGRAGSAITMPCLNGLCTILLATLATPSALLLVFGQIGPSVTARPNSILVASITQTRRTSAYPRARAWTATSGGGSENKGSCPQAAPTNPPAPKQERPRQCAGSPACQGHRPIPPR